LTKNNGSTSVAAIADENLLPGHGKKLRHFIKPMLARQGDEAFDNKDWLFEIKWDGYRAIAEKNKNEILEKNENNNNSLQAIKAYLRYQDLVLLIPARK